MDEKESNNNDNFEQLLDNDADQPVEGSTEQTSEDKPAESEQSADDKPESSEPDNDSAEEKTEDKPEESTEEESTDEPKDESEDKPEDEVEEDPEESTSKKEPVVEEVTEVIETDVVTAPESPKKKHTGLIAFLIFFFILVICGGAFAAFAIIKNQPENIALDAFSNFINAKQISVSGTFSLTQKTETFGAMGPVNITLNSNTSDVNQSGDATLNIDLPSQGKTIALSLGETVMRDGVIYVKAGGLTKLYNDLLKETIETQLRYMLTNNVETSLYNACNSYSGEEYTNCLQSVKTTTSTPAVAQAIDNTIIQAESLVEKIVKRIDGQWVELSIKDILSSDLISNYIDPTTKATIDKAYKCSVDFVNNVSKNSNEYAELYSGNKFINIEPANDSFYKLSLDANNFVNYLKALPGTQSVKDYLSCSGIVSSGNLSFNITASDVNTFTNYLPTIYAKFDGFLNHNLTELKFDQDSEHYSMATDLKFSYPSNLTVTAPTNAIPVMDLVQEINDELTFVYQNMVSV